jgi:hypothetical protein
MVSPGLPLDVVTEILVAYLPGVDGVALFDLDTQAPIETYQASSQALSLARQNLFRSCVFDGVTKDDAYLES